jgi:hypothetical protein
MAMVDPGNGRRRMAFLSHLGQNCNASGHLALPIKTANLDLVYTGANSLDGHGSGPSDMGEIVTDVLSPGDVLKVREAFGRGMGTMIEALRALPEQMMKGSETEYAL